MHMFEECLETLLKTTKHHSNCIYLVVDDHSTDETEEFVNRVKKRHDNMLYHRHTSNSGITSSLNDSLEILRTEECAYFFILNDDISFIKAGWSDLYIKGILQSGIRHFNFTDGRNIIGRKQYGEITITYHNWVRGCLEVFSRDAYKNVGGYSTEFQDFGCYDLDLSDRMILNGFTDKYLEHLLPGFDSYRANFLKKVPF